MDKVSDCLKPHRASSLGRWSQRTHSRAFSPFIQSGSNVITWETVAHDLPWLNCFCNYEIKWRMDFILQPKLENLIYCVHLSQSVGISFFFFQPVSKFTISCVSYMSSVAIHRLQQPGLSFKKFNSFQVPKVLHNSFTGEAWVESFGSSRSLASQKLDVIITVNGQCRAQTGTSG